MKMSFCFVWAAIDRHILILQLFTIIALYLLLTLPYIVVVIAYWLYVRTETLLILLHDLLEFSAAHSDQLDERVREHT